MYHSLISDFEKAADPNRAVISARFFKTGKGEYGENDIFLGLTVPDVRKLARKYDILPFEDLQKLLASKIHEHRSIALMILVIQFKKGAFLTKRYITEFYLNNLQNVNNWDLVDGSASQILGIYLLDKDREILYTLAETNHLWSQRVAVIATFAFIRKGQFDDTFALVESLLNHPHDLIHKACGWMLKEISKRDSLMVELFLEKYATKMPRTMLRYTIEKFENERRKYWLSAVI